MHLQMIRKFLLMDEPFAALDEQNKFILQEELLSIWAETGKTVLFITHSIDEALLLSDRILLMSSQPGKIIQEIQCRYAASTKNGRYTGKSGYGRTVC